LLIYKTEGNCLAASQEIEQLYWFYADTSSESTQARVDQQSQFTVFDLCEAALQHQPARIIKIISCLKENEATPPQLIVWALGQMLRALVRASDSNEGARRQILTQAGIRSTTQMLYLKVLKDPATDRWSKLLSLLYLAYKQFKSGEKENFWHNVLKINLNLSRSYTQTGIFCI
jgi:DNA polymerase III delta subunit